MLENQDQLFLLQTEVVVWLIQDIMQGTSGTQLHNDDIITGGTCCLDQTKLAISDTLMLSAEML